METGAALVVMWILTTLALAMVQMVTLAAVVGLAISTYGRGEQLAEIRHQISELRGVIGGRRQGDISNTFSSGSGSVAQGSGGAASHGGSVLQERQ